MKVVKTSLDIDQAALAVGAPDIPTSPNGAARADAVRVTWRAIVLGLLLCVGLAALNAWIETVENVHFLGGVHLPLGAIFVLGVLIVGVNSVLKAARGVPLVPRPFSAAELLTIYAMMLFGAIVSTPGTETFFLTVGAGLFYFATRENRWAETFYSYVPPSFAPGWDGVRYQREVIEGLYTGGISFAEVPWHAWMPMLISWSVFLFGCYATLFFASILLRRQWIENEALTFPLIELPLRMVDVDERNSHPPARAFWGDRGLWLGAGAAFALHVLRGMNNFYPDWPIIPSFQGNAFSIQMTEGPWRALGTLRGEYFLGGIGIAYLLTRELSGSMWMFFWIMQFQLVAAEMLGFPVATLPKDNSQGRPLFITYQSIGAWAMLAALLLWTARGHLKLMFRAAWNPQSAIRTPHSSEPFSPRAAVVGFGLSLVGLLAWCWFAGMNPLIAGLFITMYVMASLVLARLVVEGGFIFPQLPFSPLDWMTGGLLGASVIGAGDLTRLGFLQTVLFSDARTNMLPAWLHTLKIAHAQSFSPRDTRRLMLAGFAAVAVSLAVTIGVTLTALYANGALSAYGWFTKNGPTGTWNGTATMMRTNAALDPLNWGWFAIGAGVVWGIMALRSRLLWFSLHPLGYIVATGYPITRLWLSFFLGWLVKTLVLKYGGSDSAQRLRPFMVGLILGNALAMVFWMIAGYFLGGQIQYWPA
ncbi:MAG: hypothetical protein KY445_01235 [Armatimonadetes bacterium]|nr:hypothetical protein [Armatimonadota bacterium]